MRVLVCGGRDYSDHNKLIYELDVIPITHLIAGGARGADSIAEFYAKKMGIPHSIYMADWNTHGKSAGYLRNKQMLDEGKPDLVVAFPGGKGTAMMIKLAEEAGVKVIKVD